MQIFLLSLIFNLTGNRAVSERIGALRQHARYLKARKAHLDAGGTVASYQSRDGTSEFFL